MKPMRFIRRHQLYTASFYCTTVTPHGCAFARWLARRETYLTCTLNIEIYLGGKYVFITAEF